MEFTKLKNDFLFLPLGGAGEIGLNLNLYHYQGKWIILDFGAGFADDYLPGVDMIVPDITFLIEHKKDIIAMILTHAHEDHIGAVQYLWDELRCPIYTTPFTASFLKAKLSEMGMVKDVPIIEVQPKGRINLDPFMIEFVPLTHSAPEMQAVVIRTEVGNVLHTGDWKFDPNPLVGEVNDEGLLKKYGDEGILALIGDSTNVFNPGVSGSEGELLESLIKLIAQCSQLVAVTTFASNVARVDTIIRAAAACGRRVVLAGKSLWRITRAAKESGYLKNIEDFVDEREMDKYPREKLLVLCTGCQGETLAAATKMAYNSHTIKLKPQDTIIFSSKIIPGNDKKIFKLFNQFVKMNVEVMTEKDHFVHVSGHPSRDELKLMYELVRPEVAIPVHGELVHIHEHAKMALEWGAKQSIQVENGDVVRLEPGKSTKIGKVHAGYLAIDGYYLLPTNAPVMRMRRKIQKDGVVIVTLILERSHNILKVDPLILAPGSLDLEEDKELILEIISEIRQVLEQQIQNIKKIKIKTIKASNDTVIPLVKSIVKRIIKREVGKTPVVEVQIERL
jgi:ribonuclease J